MKLAEKGKQIAVSIAKSNAQKSTGLLCRLWVGQPKVPSALLEKQFQNKDITKL